MVGPADLEGLVQEVTPLAVDLRRTLHQHPEPSHGERHTTDLIAAALGDNRIDFTLRTPETGLWADIGAEPKIGFRADLDALPIQEPESNAPKSRNPGWMHACGHDAHAAIAFGIATTLHRLELPFGVRVLFQPAEETIPSGAAALVAEGLVDGLKGLLAFHVDPTLEAGRIGVKTGPITGSADGFTVTLHGPGGHTARPDKTVDLVDAAARLVSGLPPMIRQSIDSRVPMAIVFGAIHGGDAGNVIPTEVQMRGTVRTLDMSTWDVLPSLLEQRIAGLVAATGADYTLEYQRGIPPVINDEAVLEAAKDSIATYTDPQSIVSTETSMGGEDFANYLTIVPGALLRLGSFSGGGDLHSASFKINESSIGFGIKAGVAALLGMAERL